MSQLNESFCMESFEACGGILHGVTMEPSKACARVILGSHFDELTCLESCEACRVILGTHLSLFN